MKFGKYAYLVIVAFAVFAFASCKKTTLQLEIAKEQTLLEKYIAKYHSTVTPKASGLYYIETKPGSGKAIVAGDYVKVYYKGYLIEDNDTVGIRDGYNFDASGNYEPFAFTVGTSAVITGWDEAITYMKDGGEAKWIIPSKDAYGGTQSGSVPAYSTLVFYVSVYKVYRTTDTFKTIQKVPRDLLN
jgi:FKBP-type peptidyl-prolyl cis-trans isomerase